jgi:hypothetical protein
MTLPHLPASTSLPPLAASSITCVSQLCDTAVHPPLSIPSSTHHQPCSPALPPPLLQVRNGKITERWRDKKWNMKIQFLTHGYNKELSKFNLFAIKELQCPEPDLVRVHILASKDMAGGELATRQRLSVHAANCKLFGCVWPCVASLCCP